MPDSHPPLFLLSPSVLEQHRVLPNAFKYPPIIFIFCQISPKLTFPESNLPAITWFKIKYLVLAATPHSLSSRNITYSCTDETFYPHVLTGTFSFLLLPDNNKMH